MTPTYETCIIVIPIDKISDGRKTLERIQDSEFDSVEDVQNEICFDEDDPIAIEDVKIYSMDYFMDAWNNTDNSVKKKDRLKISENWFGYVQIKTPKQI
jgi:hypothetical protein